MNQLDGGKKSRIAILASGRGSNADAICEYFKDHDLIEVAIIMSNREEAGVKNVAIEHHVPFKWHSNQDFKKGIPVLETLRRYQVHYIVLAGFLRKIPDEIIKSYSRRILNIHPALLPNYGGKGMYGQNVHKAVKSSGDKETGITIHFVNQEYDKGRVIFQSSCQIDPEDSPEDIAKKVQKLEHKYFPKVIESVIESGRSTN
ncbi:MAG: phosphoribosylglycinamide formyltransferase [Saprospiraceae bacterium]|nr:phosphoribosylglycinamide formyltransferase [Saprospiraceae bacterium]